MPESKSETLIRFDLPSEWESLAEAFEHGDDDYARGHADALRRAATDLRNLWSVAPLFATVDADCDDPAGKGLSGARCRRVPAPEPRRCSECGKSARSCGRSGAFCCKACAGEPGVSGTSFLTHDPISPPANTTTARPEAGDA